MNLAAVQWGLTCPLVVRFKLYSETFIETFSKICYKYLCPNNVV